MKFKILHILKLQIEQTGQFGAYTPKHLNISLLVLTVCGDGGYHVCIGFLFGWFGAYDVLADS